MINPENLINLPMYCFEKSVQFVGPNEFELTLRKANYEHPVYDVEESDSLGTQVGFINMFEVGMRILEISPSIYKGRSIYANVYEITQVDRAEGKVTLLLSCYNDEDGEDVPL